MKNLLCTFPFHSFLSSEVVSLLIIIFHPLQINTQISYISLQLPKNKKDMKDRKGLHVTLSLLVPHHRSIHILFQSKVFFILDSLKICELNQWERYFRPIFKHLSSPPERLTGMISRNDKRMVNLSEIEMQISSINRHRHIATGRQKHRFAWAIWGVTRANRYVKAWVIW